MREQGWCCAAGSESHEELGVVGERREGSRRVGFGEGRGRDGMVVTWEGEGEKTDGII
jgi:hypothetical protein